MKKAAPIHSLLAFFDQMDGKAENRPALPVADFVQIEKQLSRPQLDILRSTEQINMFLGGQGSGKTFLAGIVTARFVQAAPHKKGLISANTYRQLTASTLFRIREVWKNTFGWFEYSEANKQGHYTVGVQPPNHFDTRNHNFDSYRGIISFINGAVIHYYSLDNYKAIDGLEISWAVLDETKDTRPEAITEVLLGRLRQKAETEKPKPKRPKKAEVNPMYIFTSPAKAPFLAEWFNLYDHEPEIGKRIFSQKTYFKGSTSPNKFVVIASTYHNARNLPTEYIANQQKNLPSHLHDMLIFGSPFAKQGGEFYKGFDRSAHVVAGLPYHPELPLHISFDFNVQPYVTLLVFQIVQAEARQVNLLDEICLPSPRNSTAAACREFAKRYRHHAGGLFVYGDPAGRHADTRSERGQNDYTIIGQQLKAFRPHFRVGAKAWAVAVRGQFINTILETEYGQIRVRMAERCKNTVADFMYLKEAADGTKHKEKTTENGVSFEKYGHCSDAFDYFICEAFRPETQRYMRGGAEKVVRTGTYAKSRQR